MKVTLHRTNNNYTLEAKNENENTIVFDNNKAGGGDDAGFRPMQSLLAAAGACSSIDVVSILKKQRIENYDLTVTIEGERETGKDANLWKKVHLHFTLTGDVPKEKAQRAVELSVTKYCSVSKTLEAAGAAVTASVEVI
ncbi:MAG: OsmC family protein [Bacteroidota bacterium]